MSDLIEVAITSDASGTGWTSSVWNPRAGTNLMSYKGGGAAGSRTATFIKNEFIVSANNSKPLIHIWPVNSQEQVANLRFVTPGRVTALAITPNGNFCVAGIAESIYIWEICSGRLLSVISKHYQSVTSIKFTDDGTHFVTGGQDGMVFVWSLVRIISSNNTNQQELYSFSDHALPVTDLYIGTGGIRGYLVTSSLDRTCKVYDLFSGRNLLSLVFEEAITSVTMDHHDTKIYVGSANGDIYEFSIQSPPRMKEYHVTDLDVKNKFTGHKNIVTCLSISLDGESLLSGSSDENVILWHIPSRQLIRTLPHKGIITNAFFTLTPKAMFDQDVKLNLISNNFKRMIDNNITEEQTVDISVTADQSNESKDDVQTKIISKLPIVSTQMNGSTVHTQKGEPSQDVESLRAEIKNLKRINKELYNFNIKNILN